jgi:hypothetical protein
MHHFMNSTNSRIIHLTNRYPMCIQNDYRVSLFQNGQKRISLSPVVSDQPDFFLERSFNYSKIIIEYQKNLKFVDFCKENF